MAFKLKYKHSAFPFKKDDYGLKDEIKKEKKDTRTKNQKRIDEGIEKGTLPKPDTKKKLKQFKEAYFEEKFV